MTPRRRRAALADAILAAGATILLLQAAGASARQLWMLALGIALVVAGAALLWGTPRPTFGARLTASLSGTLIGFGLSIGRSGLIALGAGVLLLAAQLVAPTRHR